MKLTESMIRDMVMTDLNAAEIGDLLTMTGFEIEEILEVEGEPVLDINIMANRGDGASSVGIAREILAKDKTSHPTELYKKLTSNLHTIEESTNTLSQLISIEINTPDCTRYACKCYEGIENGDSPGWLKSRLEKIGQRPISLLVDIANYVMIETGQPLHTFDLDTINDRRIIVRQANPGEKMNTLDGIERTFNSENMLICDANSPVAVAGVMGGETSEATASTKRCLLESAHFDHQSVRKTRKQLGLHTDASYRFERYVDPEGAIRAINRFTELLEQATNCNTIPGILDIYPIKPVRNSVHVRTDRTCQILGMEVTADLIQQYLSDLGSIVVRTGENFDVTPPSWRIDLVKENDYIEEVGRVHGYEKIPELLPIGSTPIGGTHGSEAKIDRIREELLRCGLNQIISHSLRDSHPLDADTKRVRVLQPHSPEMALLRNSMLPGLAEACLKNGGNDIHLFEVGKVFSQGSEVIQLGILSIGNFGTKSWENCTDQVASFYSLKGIVERTFQSVNCDFKITAPQHLDPRFHPSRQASIAGSGIFGQIHPDIAEELNLPEAIVIAEFELSEQVLVASSVGKYKQVHRYPATKRDIAILISKEINYEQIESAICNACGDVLEKHQLFDVYEGKGIDPGYHSIGIALQLRKQGTFTDEEANQVRDCVVSALELLGAKLR